MAKIISLVSGKGGTGKSTVSSSLALSLAKRGFSVLAVDLDFGLRSLDLLLGLENRVVFDLGDVLEGRCELKKALIYHEKHPLLEVLCAPLNPDIRCTPERLSVLLREAAALYDYCILDLPAGLDRSVITARELSDLVAVVTVPDRVTMRDTRNTVDLLLGSSQKPCRLIINKVGRETMAAGGLQDLDELLDAVGIQLFGVVPWDPYISSLSSGEGRGKRVSMTERVFDAMAERITGKYVPVLVKWV